MIKLSVVIPIYNTAPYLERCVCSLMEQTQLDSIEYVFINDCSTDNSYEILQNVLRRYPQRSSQVKIYSMPCNMGLGAVRAFGIEHAAGQYITHCDSDDWVEPYAYELICKKIESANSDVIINDFYVEGPKNTEIVSYPDWTLEKRLETGLWWMLWSHTVKRQLLIDNDLSTFSGIDFWEDMDLLMRVYHFAKSVSYIHTPLYHYNRTNEEAMSHSGFDLALNGPCNRVINHLLAFYESQHAEPPFRLLDMKRFVRDLYLQQSEIDWPAWLSTYNDSWRYLWKDSRFKFGYRLTYTLASWGCLFPFRFYLYCARLKK